MRILLVEDEEYMAQSVAQVLEKNNYTVDLAQDGEYGLDCAFSGIHDIIWRPLWGWASSLCWPCWASAFGLPNGR